MNSGETRSLSRQGPAKNTGGTDAVPVTAWSETWRRASPSPGQIFQARLKKSLVAASRLPHEPLDGEKLTASAPLKMLRASWRICLTSDETNGSGSKFDGNGAWHEGPGA